MIKRYSKKATEHYEYPQISTMDDIGSTDPYTLFEKEKKDVVIYIHIPFCRNNCKFCNYYKIHHFDSSVTDTYFGSLQRELLYYRPYVRCVKAVQFGGGTPTCIPLQYYHKLLAFIKNTFVCDNQLQVSMESDIRQLQISDSLAQLKECGINRVSFGVQTFNDKARLALGLPFSRDDLIEKIQVITSSSDFDCNADLMFNLPEQDPEELLCDINLCFQLGINCLDLYHLNVFPGTRMYKWMLERKWVKEYYSISRQKEFYLAYHTLIANPSINFCMSNTITMTQKAPNIYTKMQLGGADCWQLGIGASSRGFVGNAGYRNYSDIGLYSQSVSVSGLGIRSLKKCNDRFRRILVLMPNLLEMDIFGYDLNLSLSMKINQLIAEGVLHMNGNILSLDPDFYFYAGNVSEEFYSTEDAANAQNIVLNNYRNGLNMYNQDKVNMG